MSRNILILDGHPDPANDRLIHALAAAYREGAQASNHTVHVIRLADLTFPVLRSQADYDRGEPVESVRQCQDLMNWAAMSRVSAVPDARSGSKICARLAERRPEALSSV